MYDVKIFDGGDKPLITKTGLSLEKAEELAKKAVEGEQDTAWRAEIWTSAGKRRSVVYPPSVRS